MSQRNSGLCLCLNGRFRLGLVARLPTLGDAERDAVVAPIDRDASYFAPLVEPVDVSLYDCTPTRIHFRRLDHFVRARTESSCFDEPAQLCLPTLVNDLPSSQQGH